MGLLPARFVTAKWNGNAVATVVERAGMGGLVLYLRGVSAGRGGKFGGGLRRDAPKLFGFNFRHQSHVVFLQDGFRVAERD